jgi:hypothetical protein
MEITVALLRIENQRLIGGKGFGQHLTNNVTSIQPGDGLVPGASRGDVGPSPDSLVGAADGR